MNIDSAAHNNRKWPHSSDALCFYCAHQFHTIPVFIPWVSHDGTVSLYGNFCSFNCGKSWILARPKNRQTNLLTFYLMARKIFGPSKCRFQPAPPKEILQAFGGNVSISTYRESFLMITCWESLKQLQFKQLPLVKIDPVLPPITIHDYQNIPPPTIKKKCKPKNVLHLLN